MTATQLALPSAPHRNRQLFSDHYLNEVLPKRAEWLSKRRAEHDRLTAEIVRLETDLNDRVYALFDLSPADIRLIEESTKYRYGEV